MRSRLRRRPRLLLALILAACVVACFVIPVIATEAYDRGVPPYVLELFVLLVAAALSARWYARDRARRESCGSCGRERAMKRVGRRKTGYVKMRCTFCGAEKTAAIEEDELGRVPW